MMTVITPTAMPEDFWDRVAREVAARIMSTQSLSGGLSGSGGLTAAGLRPPRHGVSTNQANQWNQS